MTDVVSVKFKGRGKTYYFDPNGVAVPDGAQVIVETSKGLELAECVQGCLSVEDERIVPPLRPIVRVATADDLRLAEQCKAREKEAFAICEKKIADHRLDMKLVDVECNFEGNKMLFFFTSDGRVDFRELVKDLASVFRTRIELRQIGVRDEAKMLGGIGICGRPFCCKQFLNDFEPVSTKMAKIQSLSLNPAKISGSCGRLMCCLRYEEDAYEELVKTVPKNGAFVETLDGYGNVVQVNLLRQEVKVRLDNGDTSAKLFSAGDVAAVPGGRPKPGEAPAHVLVPKPKAAEPEEEMPSVTWTRPPVFAEDTLEKQETEKAPDAPAAEKPPVNGGNGGSNNRRRSHGRKPNGGKPRTDAQQSKAPQGDKPQKQTKSGEAQGEGKSDSGKPQNSRSRRHRSGGAPQSGGAPKTGDPSRAPAPKQAPKPAPESSAPGGAPAQGGEKKKNNNRRRRYNKPKTDGAPKGGE